MKKDLIQITLSIEVFKKKKTIIKHFSIKEPIDIAEGTEALSQITEKCKKAIKELSDEAKD